VLRKFKVKESYWGFLVWKSEIFYKGGHQEQFQNVLSGRVFKNLHYGDGPSCHQILPHLQISEDALFVRAPAVLRHLKEDFLETKITNLEPLTFAGLGYTIPLHGFDSNVFREIGLNKALLRRFSDYFF